MTKGLRALKVYRFENDLTQRKFCDKFNFNRSTIACIEAEINQPSVATAQKLGEIIGIAWSLFFEEE